MDVNVVELLEHVRKRPLMYFVDQLPAVVNFVSGFRTAALLFKPTVDYDMEYHKILQVKGWDTQRTDGVWKQMQERGYDHDKIIDEYLSLHIAVWENLLKKDSEA